MFENVSLRLLIWGLVESVILWANFETFAIPVNDVKTGLTLPKAKEAKALKKKDKIIVFVKLGYEYISVYYIILCISLYLKYF